jgi:glycosyltransferase involved in cell wall biosynthesis
MKKHVIVVNTAARLGGALTILKQFLDSISKYSNKDIIYHVFVSVDLTQYKSDNVDIIVLDRGSSYIKRFFAEFHYLKQWCKNNEIKPSLIISLQNIAIGAFKGIPQLIYLHQPLAFRKDLKWNIFKSDERTFWFYRNIYDKLIKKSITPKDEFIVQTQWIKENLVSQFAIDERRVHIIKPKVDEVDKNLITNIGLPSDEIKMFYPTSIIKYKNYKILFEALDILRNNKDVNKKFKLYITLKEEDIYDKDILKNIRNQVDFLGPLPYSKVLEYYNSTDMLVFPSYVETFGLPLIEGAKFGLKIVAADLPYSHEVLGNYSRAKYVKYDDASQWARAILEISEKNLGSLNWNYLNTGWAQMFQLIEKKIYE